MRGGKHHNLCLAGRGRGAERAGEARGGCGGARRSRRSPPLRNEGWHNESPLRLIMKDDNGGRLGGCHLEPCHESPAGPRGLGGGDPGGRGPGPGSSARARRRATGPTQAAALVFAAVAGFIRLRSLTGVEFM